MSNLNKCPYCENKDPVPNVVHMNAEIYGGSLYNVCCKHCGGALKIGMSRIVVVTGIQETIFDECDWGHKPKLIKNINKKESKL